MSSFEAIAELAFPSLCQDCPVRSLSSQVELARLAFTSGDLDAESLAAMEAEAAAKIAFTSVFKSEAGCDGSIVHEETCGCGNDRSCGAFTVAYEIIDQE